MRVLGLVLAGVLGTLSGCVGARDVDDTPQRGYSADISASLDHGPTSLRPGVTASGEPSGALPWRIPDDNR